MGQQTVFAGWATHTTRAMIDRKAVTYAFTAPFLHYGHNPWLMNGLSIVRSSLIETRLFHFETSIVSRCFTVFQVETCALCLKANLR